MMKQSKTSKEINHCCTDSLDSEFRSIIDQKSLERFDATRQCKEELL